MRRKGDTSWGPLTEEQKKLAESMIPYVKWFMKKGKGIRCYISKFGPEEVYSLLLWSLCRSAWYFNPNHPSGFTFCGFVAYHFRQALSNFGQRAENKGRFVPYDFRDPDNGWYESNRLTPVDIIPDIDPVELDEETAILSDRLDKLTPNQREVVIRTVALDEGVMNLARERGTSHTSITIARNRGMKRLRKMYGVSAGNPQREPSKRSKKTEIAA